MNKYELYNRVVEMKDADEGTFIACARNWIEGADESNFNNEEADELFAKAKQYCMLWRKEAINGRISKRRMIDCVRKIVEMNLPNPYDPNEQEPVVEEPVVEEPVVEEKKIVLGVVEDKKEERHIFGKRKKQGSD